LSLLIWFKVIIESEHFEIIGESEATKIGEFVSLTTLGISGHIKERSNDGNTMMLTNGILLELNNATKLEKISNFRDRMIMYSSKRFPTLIDLQMEQIEVKLYQNFILSLERQMNLECRLEKTNRDIFRAMLTSFPNSAKNILATPGHRINNLGEVALISKCEVIVKFEIVWSRKINQSYFENFPVKIPGRDWMFLNLLDRELIVSSPKIKCSSRGLVFIRSGEQYYIINEKGGLLNKTTSFRNEHIFKEVKLDKNIRIDPRFFQEMSVDHLTILSLLSRSVNSISNVNEIFSKDNDISKSLVGDVGFILEALSHSTGGGG